MKETGRAGSRPARPWRTLHERGRSVEPNVRASQPARSEVLQHPGRGLPPVGCGGEPALHRVGLRPGSPLQVAPHEAVWPEVARRTEEWHESRGAAYAAEMNAIAVEASQHNTMGTPTYVTPDTPAIRRRQELASVRSKLMRQADDLRRRAVCERLTAGVVRRGGRGGRLGHDRVHGADRPVHGLDQGGAEAAGGEEGGTSGEPCMIVWAGRRGRPPGLISRTGPAESTAGTAAPFGLGRQGVVLRCSTVRLQGVVRRGGQSVRAAGWIRWTCFWGQGMLLLYVDQQHKSADL